MRLSGETLRTARLARFLSQQDLADRAGTTEATVNRLEQDRQRARLSTIRKLAAALGVEPAELMVAGEGEDEKPRPGGEPDHGGNPSSREVSVE